MRNDKGAILPRACSKNRISRLPLERSANSEQYNPLRKCISFQYCAFLLSYTSFWEDSINPTTKHFKDQKIICFFFLNYNSNDKERRARYLLRQGQAGISKPLILNLKLEHTIDIWYFERCIIQTLQ